MYICISVMIESVNFSIMQLIMSLHTYTAFLFWAKHLGFLKMSILEYSVMLLISFYMSACYKFYNFKYITSEICNIFWVPIRTNLSDVYGAENYLYRFLTF